ncbi:MAG: TldD/PmbA family protein [Proteobacteria bacterium]|nr:TldD/PmbA family protein [Pseudomonadota bacterium]
MLDDCVRRFREVAPACDAWTLRSVDEEDEHLHVQRGVVQPPAIRRDQGVMVTVYRQGGVGYAGTSDLSTSGLRAAGERAGAWAERAREAGVAAFSAPELPPDGEYASAVREDWNALPVADKLALLVDLDRSLTGPQIVDREALLWRTQSTVGLAGSEGGRVVQHFDRLVPMLQATANEGSESQTRTYGGHAFARQGGLEILDEIGLVAAAPRVAEEAAALLSAPDCPSGSMDVLLAPDQMILQIHESIGHPLELDRILGDERNYAGTSFVTPDMFGHYAYGSELLNVSFDPTVAGEFASYAFDDDGLPARKEMLIERGVLLRGLGGAASQARSGLAGCATARADGWNRPPIDRMANLNLEPGAVSFDELVASVEDGVYMETNCSWSIDDARNKFQFGCEVGRTIRNGELGSLVRKPNYRGVSATFWRSLAGVGGPETRAVLGTPYCGKGEPNQVIRVGHASPACVFRGVDVFGGE